MSDKLDEVMKNLGEAETKINAEGQNKPSEAVQKPVEGGVVTPKKMAAKTAKNKPQTVSEKLHEFVVKSGAVYCENEGTPYAKYFATFPAWQYLLRLHGCHVELNSIDEDEDSINRSVTHVYAKGVLVKNATQEVIGKAEMCASTNEKFLLGKPLSAAYGLAQTRLLERLARNAFASDLVLARLEPVGAEELDVDPAKYGTKGEEV